ncbi:MAG: hypothetical protein V4671_15800, partial [Armatimonadota bacterium]
MSRISLVNGHNAGSGCGRTLIGALGLRRYRPHWPGFLIAIGVAAVVSLVLANMGLTVATIGSRYGGIPNTLPVPALPPFSLEKFGAVLPDALAMALL